MQYCSLVLELEVCPHSNIFGVGLMKSKFQKRYNVDTIWSIIEAQGDSLLAMSKRACRLAGVAIVWLNVTNAYSWGEVAFILQKRTKTRKAVRAKAHKLQ